MEVLLNQHESFQCILSSFARFLENFSEGHPSKDYFKSSTLNCGVFMEWTTKKKMHIVDIGDTKQFLYVFIEPYAFPYLYDLGITLIPMWIGLSRNC